MSHWWRAHDEAIDDPKLCLLSDRGHRAWFNLCCLTSSHGGTLPAEKVILLKLRMPKSRWDSVLVELKEAGLIDEDETGMRPHNWNGRQFKSDVSTERVQRFRKRPRNVSSTVSETPPDTEYRKKDAANAALELPLANEEVELFRRGKAVLGNSSGGLIKSLLKAKSGQIPLARAAIEQASTKQNPREYIGAVIRGTGDHQQQADPRL